MENFSELNDSELREELVQAAQEEEKQVIHSPKTERKTTKKAIIEKIFKCYEDRGLVCPDPESKLKRMSKNELMEYLASVISQAMQEKITSKLSGGNLSVPEDASDTDRQRLMAGSFLLMAHKILTQGVEKLVPAYTPYEVDGFSSQFEEPEVRDALQECLLEIGEELDVIQYVDSPYSKLGLLWCSGVFKTLRHKQ